MPKRRQYTEEDRAIALIFLDRCRGDYAEAARRAGVEEKRLRLWAEGIEEAVIQEKVAAIQPAAPPPGRPMPPQFLLEPDLETEHFIAAPEVGEWLRNTFISERGPLHNDDHWHLEDARIGVLWTNCLNVKNGKRIVGQCEWTGGGGAKWAKGRAEYQMRRWFGDVPDFLITFDATYAGEVDDWTWCALSEHELLHCGAKGDGEGTVKLDRFGNPIFCVRPHDVEEFVVIVARYGAGHAAGKTAQLVEAASRRPLIAQAKIDACCGTCLR